MKEYYLVATQCDAYICLHWFEDKEVAEYCSANSEGKEEIVETVRAEKLEGVIFSDGDYRAEMEESSKIRKAEDKVRNRPDYPAELDENIRFKHYYDSDDNLRFTMSIENPDTWDHEKVFTDYEEFLKECKRLYK